MLDKEYDFDDVLIIPSDNCWIDSRDKVFTGQVIKRSNKRKLELGIPIIGSPMKGIMNANLAIGLARNGGIGILHRFYDDPEDWEKEINSIKNTRLPFGVSVSLDKDDDRYEYALDEGANIICIDIANGHLDILRERTSQIASHIETNSYNSFLMVGNVVTSKTLLNLFKSGADLVRVGIGGGALCTTRNVTGIGRPQISAISECAIGGILSRMIVADGGIRNSGDIVKALMAGADFVMLGSLLAKAYESAHNGIIYGMASKKLQEDYYHSVKSIEGIEKEIEATISLDELIAELISGVKSAFTYLGGYDIQSARENARFVEVGSSSIKKL